MPREKSDQTLNASTGIDGLDAFIGGGLPRKRLYLVEGEPGVGKTTLALQFLLEGIQEKETVLLISLAETQNELEAVAKSHGWSLEGLNVFNLGPTQFGEEEQYSIMQPSDIELSDTLKRVFEEVDRLKPNRVVLDSLSEIKLLAQNPLRFRRQVMALKHHFDGKDCTVLLLEDASSPDRDLTIQSLVHGVIELQQHSPVYGKARRKIQVIKLRGVDFQAGYHDFNIVKGGIEIYPRLIAAEHHKEFKNERCTSGSKELDAILGGGLDRGTATLIMGPAGCGKSSLAALYAFMAAERGEKAVIFTFDEGIETLLVRTAVLNMDLKPHVENGNIKLQQVDPAEMSPGEFTWHVKEAIDNFGAQTVVIDSLTGFLDAMPESQFLTIQMHEMLTFLNQQGVTSILTMAQHGYIGNAMQSPADVSYLADTVILLRYFEVKGDIKKAISVIKKRSSKHETSIREYQLGPDKITVGQALSNFHGILTGTPTFMGPKDSIMGNGNDGKHR